MDEWVIENLACPRDGEKLQVADGKLACNRGHTYPVVDDIPILLVRDARATHGYFAKTFKEVDRIEAGENIEAVIPSTATGSGDIDDYVKSELQRTCGNLYKPLMASLDRYPIPPFRLEPTGHNRLLDIGCNWGRWPMAAARNGFAAVGIDPSLEAVLAARRVARQLDLKAAFLVGDARHLPFRDAAFDTVFSYSVLQHFSRENCESALDEAARVLKSEGKSLIQMASRNGIRSRQQIGRQRFAEKEKFDVRYWDPKDLIETFEKKIGPTKITADCYFGLGIQPSDIDLMPPRYKIVVSASEILRRISTKFTSLVFAADSVYLESIKR